MFSVIPSPACAACRRDPCGRAYRAKGIRSHHRGYSPYNSPLRPHSPLQFQVAAAVDFYVLSAMYRCPKKTGIHTLVEGHLPAFGRHVSGVHKLSPPPPPKGKRWKEHAFDGLVCDDDDGLFSLRLKKKTTMTIRKVVHAAYSLSLSLMLSFP